MAGSLKWFDYDTDNGANFAIFMDESNGEAMPNRNYTADSVASFKLPGNVEARYARYSSPDNRYAREVVCSTPAILLAAPGTLTVRDGNGGTVVLQLRARIGEIIRRIPTPVDTGVTDGDAT